MRRGEDGRQLSCLPQQRLQPYSINNVVLVEQLQPQDTLVSLFHHNPDSRDELSFRTRPANRPVICGNRSPAPQQLVAHHLRFTRVRQRPKQSNYTHRELLCSVPQLFRTTHNYSITRLLNYSITQFFYRSTSPKTMSSVPITATTSATSAPSTILLSACRFTNDGGRTRIL